MKVCARVWMSINYSTKPPHTHTHTQYAIPRDILLARHSSTCLFVSVSPSPLSLSVSHFLLSSSVENYKVRAAFFSK